MDSFNMYKNLTHLKKIRIPNICEQQAQNKVGKLKTDNPLRSMSSPMVPPNVQPHTATVGLLFNIRKVLLVRIDPPKC